MTAYDFYVAKAVRLTKQADNAMTPRIAEAYRLMANRMADLALRSVQA